MCKKSTKANWIALPRIRLFSQFAQRTINKSNNVWRRNVCRSQCRNMENKEADQKLGNGTWVSKPKKIFTHVQCIYKCILHFCQCNENCIVLSPWREFFVCGGTYETKSCYGRREADWQRAVAVARGSECFYSRPFCVAIVVVVGITHQLALV